MEDMYRISVGKPEGPRLLRRPRYRWKDSIKMDLKEMGCQGMGCVYLHQDRERVQAVVNTLKSY
jgi:hypothetical protein